MEVHDLNLLFKFNMSPSNTLIDLDAPFYLMIKNLHSINFLSFCQILSFTPTKSP